MTAILAPLPRFRVTKASGEPADGYKVYTYLANSVTPAATYSNRAGTVPNANPVILDAQGEATIYLTPGVVYDFVIHTNSGALYRTDEDVTADAGDAASVSFTQAGTGAKTRTIQDKGRDTVSVDDFEGVTGDGTTDDLAGITNAMNQAIARGVPLSFNGTKSYALASTWLISSGAKIQTNGCTFVDTVGSAGNTLLIDIEDNVVIDRLKVTVGTGITRQRCIRGTGACEIGEIIVTYTDQQAIGETSDAAVRFTNVTRLRAGRVEVTKHDAPMAIETGTDIIVDSLKFTSYLRGLYLLDCTNWRFGPSTIATASANASYTSGHNGVLVESSTADATRNGVLEDFIVENAGEHAISIAGTAQLSNLYIVRPRIKTCGGSGINILGTLTNRKKRIQIENPVIEDCGQDTTSKCGILAQYCDDVTIDHPIIRKESKASSAHTGIRLTACTLVTITQPMILSAAAYGIFLDGVGGDVEQVVITGGMVRANADSGFRASTSTSTFRRIKVNGLTCSANTLFGATFGGNAIDCEMHVQTTGGGSAVAGDTASVHWDITGAPGATAMASVVARNGSRWSDGTTLNIRKAGAWVAL